MGEYQNRTLCSIVKIQQRTPGCLLQVIPRIWIVDVGTLGIPCLQWYIMVVHTIQPSNSWD